MTAHPLVRRINALMPAPTDPPTEQPPWDQVPEQTGFRLPQDYRDFMDLYGDGEINAARRPPTTCSG